MPYPIAVSSWAGDPRGTALLYDRTEKHLTWTRCGPWPPDAIQLELGGRAHLDLVEENSRVGDDVVVMRACKAHGMGLVDYLDEIGVT